MKKNFFFSEEKKNLWLNMWGLALVTWFFKT